MTTQQQQAEARISDVRQALDRVDISTIQQMSSRLDGLISRYEDTARTINPLQSQLEVLVGSFMSEVDRVDQQFDQLLARRDRLLAALERAQSSAVDRGVVPAQYQPYKTAEKNLDSFRDELSKLAGRRITEHDVVSLMLQKRRLTNNEMLMARNLATQAALLHRQLVDFHQIVKVINRDALQLQKEFDRVAGVQFGNLRSIDGLDDIGRQVNAARQEMSNLAQNTSAQMSRLEQAIQLAKSLANSTGSLSSSDADRHAVEEWSQFLGSISALGFIVSAVTVPGALVVHASLLAGALLANLVGAIARWFRNIRNTVGELF